MSLTAITINKINGTEKTLLDQLEEVSAKTMSECRDGYCGSCAVKILSGEIEYHKVIISPVGQDIILPCSCRPKSSIVVVELRR